MEIDIFGNPVEKKKKIIIIFLIYRIVTRDELEPNCMLNYTVLILIDRYFWTEKKKKKTFQTTRAIQIFSPPIIIPHYRHKHGCFHVDRSLLNFPRASTKNPGGSIPRRIGR